MGNPILVRQNPPPQHPQTEACKPGFVWDSTRGTCVPVASGPAGGSIAQPPGWSTGAKVAVGVGAGLTLALALYGAHRAGWI